MLLLFTAGVMNLLWVAALAVIVLVQKVLPDGVGDPGVAEAVDGDAPRAVSDLDLFSFAGIARREPRHRVGAAIGDPNPIPPIPGRWLYFPTPPWHTGQAVGA